MKKLNLNDKVRVRLNDRGEAAWRKNWGDGVPGCIRAGATQPDGTIELALWEVFQAFGPVIGLGMEVPFVSCELLVPEESLR